MDEPKVSAMTVEQYLIMEKQIDTYLEKLREKHSKTGYEDVLIKLSHIDTASAILEVEGIIEALEGIEYSVENRYSYLEKLNFYKQALLKLKA